MQLVEEIVQIQTHEDLAKFIEKLRREYQDHPGRWENNDLSSFLEAMVAWVADSEGYYRNHGQPVPDAETWRTLARVLYASRMYE
jgi:hypothetical protein